MNADRWPEILEVLGWVLIHSIWQFVSIGVVLGIVLTVLGRRSPRIAYGACLAAMCFMPIGTAYTFMQTSRVRASGLEGLSQGTVTEHADAEAKPAFLRIAAPRGPIARSGEASPRESHGVANSIPDGGYSGSPALRLAQFTVSIWARLTSWLQPWTYALSVVWMTGVMALSLRPMIAWYYIRRLRKTGIEEVTGHVNALVKRLARQLGISRSIVVVRSTLVSRPATIGMIKPMILLPASVLTRMSQEQLEALIAHELAHIRRLDYVVNAFQIGVETLFFYHPCTWWISSRARHYREQCCDFVAVSVTGDRIEYANMLVWLDENLPNVFSFSLSLSASDGVLVQRIRRILDPTPSHMRRGPIALLTAGLALSVLAMSCITLAICASPSRLLGSDSQKALRPQSYNDTIVNAFTNSLSKRLTLQPHEGIIRSLADELKEYLESRGDSEPSIEVTKQAVSFVRRTIAEWPVDTPRKLRRNFEFLCRRTWFMAESGSLPPDDLKRRHQQREWMRSYIRELPVSSREEKVSGWCHAGRLTALENEVFQNPLFHSPMSDPEFQHFQTRLVGYQQGARLGRLMFAPSHIMLAAIKANSTNRCALWPPLPPGSDLPSNSTFASMIFSSAFHCQLVDHEGVLQTYDADSSSVDTILVNNRASTANSTSIKRVTTRIRGDLRWDAARKNLVAIANARLAVLSETSWTNIISIPVEELRDHVALHARRTIHALGKMRQSNLCREPTPILVLQSNGGQLIFLRVQQVHDDSVYLQVRPIQSRVDYPAFDCCDDCGIWNSTEM